MTEIPLSELTSRVAFVDPAAGKTALKKQSARSAIACVAGDKLDRIFVLDAWGARTSTEKLIERICWTYDTFHPSIIGIEANAMQVIFSDAVMLLLKSRGIILPLVPIPQPTHIDKDSRIRYILQPILGFGRLVMTEKMVELQKEITSFPSGRMKDIIDALASACTLLPARTVEKQRDDKYAALASYHRKIGTPAEAIRLRVAEARHADGLDGPTITNPFDRFRRASVA